MNAIAQGSENNVAWLSAYLFHDTTVYGSESDKHLLERIYPFVKQCEDEMLIGRWFFIRYSERGPHLRLRLQGDRQSLVTIVKPALEAHVKGCPPLRPNASAENAGQAGDGHEGITRVEWVEYEPETRRYGGPEGVSLAEELFYRSSESAVAIVRAIDGRREARMGRALLAMVLTMYVFCGDRERVAHFARRYGTGYLASAKGGDATAEIRRAFDAGYNRQAEVLSSYVAEAWERLVKGEGLTDDLHQMQEQLIVIQARFAELAGAGRLLRHDGSPATVEQAVSEILPSYVHMMNNRIGVTIVDEAYLAYLIQRALGTPPRDTVRSRPRAVSA